MRVFSFDHYIFHVKCPAGFTYVKIYMATRGFLATAWLLLVLVLVFVNEMITFVLMTIFIFIFVTVTGKTLVRSV